MSLQPGTGFTFSSSSNGTNFNVQQPWSEWSPGGTLEQFQIVVSPYSSGEGPPTQSLIRVVKGEVVWSPKLLQDNPLIPIPISSTCVAQKTITDWYGGIPYTSIDDDQDAYIGNGGLLVSNAAVNIGIFIFKATNLPTDYDPIIVAAPDFAPTCPVAFPFAPPVESAFWDLVKIGSVTYVAPNPEAEPPVAGGWVITQKFIGSMTLPGDGKGNQEPVTSSQLPAQLVYSDGSGGTPSPFECKIVSINGQRFLQIGVGSINYTSSAMPLIKGGAATRIMQAYANKVQICPSGTRNYGDLYPIYPFNDPGYSLTAWMEDGGGYSLSDTNDPLTLYAFKWDVAPGVAPFSDSAVVNTGLPTLALIASSNSADQNKIAVDPGPSLYVQTMNIQPMTGYSNLPAPFPDSDWGYCHTSWLNPRKLGYSYKAIATITPEANTFSMVGGIERVGIPLVQNQVQHISLIGKASGGTALISCGGSTSVIPFPVTTFWDAIAPIYSDELTLANCLNSMPPITLTVDGEETVIPFTGNVAVSRAAEGSYYVTFCNQLQGLNLPQLTFNTSGVTAYAYDFQITQYITGTIDLTTPMTAGMVQLRNVPDEDEEDDPYNANEEADWDQIVNKAECVACTGFSGDVTTSGMFNMTGATAIPVDYSIDDACGDPCAHPFHVRKSAAANTFTVCTGMVNNEIPNNNASTFTIEDGFIYLEVPYDGSTKAFPKVGEVILATGVVMPDSDEDFSYVAIAQIVAGEANQLVTGSLWGDRIQVGSGITENAYYYYAQV